MLKLIGAVHILCRNQIKRSELQRARELLEEFVDEYEEIYGHINMVFNVHLLLHTTDCVQKNGPLFAYSNYCFEDNIGHLISFVRGPTDVLAQIVDRYTLEKILMAKISKSPKTREFHERIQHHTFSSITRIGGNYLVGEPKTIEMNFILRYLGQDNQTLVKMYRAIFVDNDVYFEILSTSSSKRSHDSFVCNPIENIFGEITHILIINGSAYFIVNNKYRPINLHPLSCFIELMEREGETIIVKPSLVCSKFALMKTDKIITCSEFPNMFEKN